MGKTVTKNNIIDFTKNALTNLMQIRLDMEDFILPLDANIYSESLTVINQIYNSIDTNFYDTSPWISPTSNAGVEIEWYRNHNIITIELTPTLYTIKALKQNGLSAFDSLEYNPAILQEHQRFYKNLNNAAIPFIQKYIHTN